MYLPAHFSVTDRAIAIEVMTAHPFALLVSADAGGEPFATPLPLAHDERDGALVLTGHVARANPHSALLGLAPRVLAVFNGPHAYVSPARYGTREAVPTWNYVTVHAYGDVRLIEDAQAKDHAQKRLIGANEPGYAAQWNALPERYRGTMLDAITVFEIAVDRIEAKFKLSQNRSPEDRERIRSHQAAGSADERALADWMRRLGIA